MESCPGTKDDAADYPEFIIGENEYGKPVKYTCDPDVLPATSAKSEARLFANASVLPEVLNDTMIVRPVHNE